jgi:hypothetical protein
MVKLTDYISIALGDNAWTPDLPFLTRQYSYVPLFVYNQFRLGMSECRHLNGAPLLGHGVTVSPNYQVLMTDDGEPIAFPDKTKKENVDSVGRVSGEIFQVSISRLSNIDREMCNTVHVRRRQVPIRFQTSRENTSGFVAGCWMYEAIEDNLRPFIHSFRQAPMLTTSTGEPTFLYTSLMDYKVRHKNRGVL